MLKQLIRLFLCITTDLLLKPHTDRSFVIQQSHSSLCFISGVFFCFCFLKTSLNPAVLVIPFVFWVVVTKCFLTTVKASSTQQLTPTCSFFRKRLHESHLMRCSELCLQINKVEWKCSLLYSNSAVLILRQQQTTGE